MDGEIALIRRDPFPYFDPSGDRSTRYFRHSLKASHSASPNSSSGYEETTITAPHWAQTLRSLGLDSFDAFWNLSRNWVEEPNRKGNAWSGVSRHEFRTADGRRLSIFLKRQENYYLKPMWRYLGMTSAVREWRNIERLNRLGIGVANMIFFGSRSLGSSRRCLLATEALDDYESFDNVVKTWNVSASRRSDKYRVVQAIADIVTRLHEHKLSFSALYPKHIFLNRRCLSGDASVQVPVRLVDLERVRRRFSRAACTFRDLEKLNRYCRHLSASIRLRFYKAYRGIDRLGHDDKRFIRRLLRRGS